MPSAIVRSPLRSGFILLLLALAGTAALLGLRAPERDERAHLPPFGVSPAEGVSHALTEPQAPVPLVGPVLYDEDFEHGWGGWATAPHEGAGWFRLNAATCGGLYAMCFGLDARTPFRTQASEHFLTLERPLDLRRAKAPYLLYTIKGRSEPEAALRLQPEIAAEGGSWLPAGPPALGRYRYIYTRFAPLSELAGKRGRLRFRLSLAQGGDTLGFYLDDVQIIDTGVKGPQARLEQEANAKP